MNFLDPVRTTRWFRIVALFAGIPATANAGFSKPLYDLPDRLGTGTFAMDTDWSLLGLLGLVIVVGLLAAYHRRDRQD